MNTVMNNKYSEMHKGMLSLCEQNGIRMIAGRRVSFEICSGRDINGIKDFLLVPDDFRKFGNLCVQSLKDSGYTVTQGKIKNNKVFRIFRTDILATTVPALMKNPEARHCPQFIVRELYNDNGNYSYTINSSTVSFAVDVLSDMTAVPYQKSTVYMKSDMTEHLREICGSEPEKVPAPAYGLFSTECTAAEFLKEAEKRGYLSAERIARFNEYTEWKKENRTEVDKKYKEYQEFLLGLKQP